MKRSGRQSDSWKRPASVLQADRTVSLSQRRRGQGSCLVGPGGEDRVQRGRILAKLDQPAAKRLGLPLEEREELAEGAGAEQVLALLEELGSSVPALSTHGDVIADLIGWDKKSKKGSIWVLELDGGEVRAESYLPPA